MRVLILGGGGFIGTAIVARLQREKGLALRVLERPEVAPDPAIDLAEIEWFSGNFSQPDDLRRSLEGVDVVIHLASTTTPQSSYEDMLRDMESNLAPCLALLGEMRAMKIPRIIFISSGGTVYGPSQWSPMDESHPTNPVVPYGIAKLAIEKYLGMFHRLHGLGLQILRVANPYGPRQRLRAGQGVVAAFLSALLRNQPIEIWGDGEAVRDYLHVEDVAEAFAKVIRYEGPETLFNIGSGVGVSLRQLIQVMGKVTQSKPIIRYFQPRKFDVGANVLDCSRACAVLGWKAQISLEEGLRGTCEWLRQNGARPVGLS